MVNQSGYVRWWDNYLVRYLLPSIAGMIIILWLTRINEDFCLRELLLLPISAKDMESQSLILLLLYGHLFCYLASFPVLVFHITRMIDFDNKSDFKPLNNYYLIFGGLFIIFLLYPCLKFLSECIIDFLYDKRLLLVFTFCILFSIWQICRIRNSRKEASASETEPIAFTYITQLAWMRANASLTQPSKGSEIVETYRHMREHGNSAYIFAMEIILASLFYIAIDSAKHKPELQLIHIAIISLIWAVPAVFVHMHAQYLERKFSEF